MERISDKVIGRLARYRAFLSEQLPTGRSHVFSHEIAASMRMTASQVRRDLMVLGYYGVPRYGYEVEALLKHINGLLDSHEVLNVAVIGVGNLGKALMAFLETRRATLQIVAAFDVDATKVNRVYHGIRCLPMTDLESVVARENIRLAILCVPAQAAQAVAEKATHAGVRGFLNFAPAPIRVPHGVAIEEIDVTSALEKVAYYTHRNASAAKEMSHV